MSGSDHAILDLGTDDDLQFTTNNYKVHFLFYSVILTHLTIYYLVWRRTE